MGRMDEFYEFFGGAEEIGKRMGNGLADGLGEKTAEIFRGWRVRLMGEQRSAHAFPYTGEQERQADKKWNECAVDHNGSHSSLLCVRESRGSSFVLDRQSYAAATL